MNEFPVQPPTPPPADNTNQVLIVQMKLVNIKLPAMHVSSLSFNSFITLLLLSKTVTPIGTLTCTSGPRLPKMRAFELSSPDFALIAVLRYLFERKLVKIALKTF